MSSVVLSGDSSGTVTLTVPSAAGTNTATLPAATGTVMVSGNQPAFSAYASSNQSISSGVFTKVQIDTEVFDTNNNFASYRFTPTVAGYYQINGAVQFASAGVNNLASIYKNGSEIYRGTQGSIFQNIATGLVSMNGSTDYIEFYGFQNSGGNSNVGDRTIASGSLVRAA